MNKKEWKEHSDWLDTFRGKIITNNSVYENYGEKKGKEKTKEKTKAKSGQKISRLSSPNERAEESSQVSLAKTTIGQ